MPNASSIPPTLAVEDDGDVVADAAAAAAPELDEISRARALIQVQRALFGEAAEIDPPAIDPRRPGAAVGRYVVLEHIGEGGMGAVTRAYDPRLRREVALKRLIARPRSEEGSARLLREAQAMAQLSHPNVVGVHDVETIGDEVVLVMEYVAGRTLRQWLAERKRSYDEIVAAFLDAGAGLLAAHRVGIVHRDFKPSNVLVAADGTVKVTDFGLAKAVGAADSTPGSDPPSSDAIDELASPLTRADTVLGTPRYMAPEQHAGLTDAKVDQFAFCVALWEALCEKPPFPGRSMDGLIRRKREGPPPWTGPRIPASIISAIRVGLAPEPERRFTDMRALLDALRPPARSRRVAIAIAAVLVGGGAIAASLAGTAPERCGGARRQLDGVWDDAQRAAVQDAFARTQLAYADGASQRVLGTLDRWADAWVQMHEDTCEATAVRGEQSNEVLDLRMACLHRVQQQVQIVARTLADADTKVVDNVPELLAALPAVERCADVDALRADVAPPVDPHVAEAVEHARLGLVQARALRAAGNHAAAQAISEAWTPAATALDYAPLIAEAALERGRLLHDRAQYDPAEAELRTALVTALGQGAWALAADAATTLALNLGTGQRRHAEGAALADLALALAQGSGHEGDAVAFALGAAAEVAEASGDYKRAETMARRAVYLRRQERGPDDPATAQAEVTLSLTLNRLGRFDESGTLLEHSLQVWRGVLGPDHPRVAATMNHLGMLEISRGRYDQAETFFTAAIEKWSHTLGSDHLMVAHATANLGLALHHQSRHAEAEVQHRRGLQRREELLGRDHLTTLASLNNLGLTLEALGRLDEAEEILERARQGRERALGPDHVETGSVTNTIGMVQLARKDWVAAEASFRQSLRIWERHLDPDHYWVGAAWNNIASALLEQGRRADADDAHRRALEIWGRSLRPDHPYVAHAAAGLGESLLEQGKLDEARALLERAWAIRAFNEGNASLRAESAFALARALHKIDRDRSLALLMRAREELATTSGEKSDDLRAEIHRWSRRHR